MDQIRLKSEKEKERKVCEMLYTDHGETIYIDTQMVKRLPNQRV